MVAKKKKFTPNVAKKKKFTPDPNFLPPWEI